MNKPAVQVSVSAVDRPKTLTKASNQWRERPADQRFETLPELLSATQRHMQLAALGTGQVNQLQVQANGESICLIGKSGAIVEPNHWAFGQLCQRAGAPASYLRSLPTSLVVPALQHGLSQAPDEKGACLLIQKPQTGNVGIMRAITTEKYKRIWNHEIASALVDLQERQPAWQFPQPFRTVNGSSAKPHGGAQSKQIPIAFASDHDMFVFLCDYEHGIDLGNGNVLARGFFVENSEVGDGSFRLTMFLFDFVCSNILVWGARNVVEVKLNHVGRVRDRVLRHNGEVLQALAAYSNTKASDQRTQILNAQNTVLGKNSEEVLATLFGRKSLQLAKGDIVEAQAVAHATPRYGNPYSVWALVNGLTEVSQRSAHADKRIKLDRAAGEVLQTFAF